MKGIVFTELMEMVEQTFGYEVADELVEENQLPSGGAYTSVGTYQFEEMVILLQSLSQKTETPIPDLMHAFGKYIFQTFKKNYPVFLNAADSSFDFLESIEKYIHVEVRKLYPDAELPTFKTNRISPNQLEMYYFSERKMGPFAKGLIESSLEHYGDQGDVQMSKIDEQGKEVKFIINRA
ncbi:MAG: heme NO-binding domain-containing protein [Saprospiraceae bacterium]|nr:heme NO-binding domain-containing protein [Saprospiraceae bacterium]